MLWTMASTSLTVKGRQSESGCEKERGEGGFVSVQAGLMASQHLCTACMLQ